MPRVMTTLLLLFFCLLVVFHSSHPFVASQTSNVVGFGSTNDCLDDRELPIRTHVASLTEFGAVGDGITLNTLAFQTAIDRLQTLAPYGGAQLNIPAGKWLTGSFNLTSYFTLHLEKGAIILGSQNPKDWPVIDPLPSYGRGRERPGGRHISLVHGQNLVDVVITGERGTIDGQGGSWWEMWNARALDYTRGHLVEFVSSENIIISNVVLRNSPFWTIHPVYCEYVVFEAHSSPVDRMDVVDKWPSNVIVKGVSILAPRTSPNTDGIDPDSSSNVCIEDCYIRNGDDLISLKSGWDEYGIAVGRPSSNIIVRRVTGTTPFSGISFGSEMSGGIKNVYISNIHVFNTGTGIKVKAAPGRGGYITNITISGMTMEKVMKAIDFSDDTGEHPDDNFNRDAMPLVKGIVIDNIVGYHISSAGRFLGIKESPLLNICLSNISLNLLNTDTWYCSYVQGSASSVFPQACPELNELGDQFCGNI